MGIEHFVSHLRFAEPLDRFNVEVPQPTTESPTPNKKPTWTWVQFMKHIIMRLQ